MKLYLSDLDKLLNLIAEKKLASILLYGPDKGYISKICAVIAKKFNFLPSVISYKEIKPSDLAMMVNLRNFFNQQELIKIIDVGTSFDKAFKSVLAGPLYNFVVFIADELSPSSSLRKFYETEPHLASIGCYHDDPQNIAKIIAKKAQLANKIIDSDAASYLKEHLKGDHQLILNELNKLFYFTHNKNNITIEDVKSVISHDLLASGDELCMYFTTPNLAAFLDEATKLKEQGVNEVLMIRALLRYHINLYIVLSKLADGKNLELAMKELSPPIFFKYAPHFKNTVKKLTIEKCVHIIEILQQAEVDFKLRPNAFNWYIYLYSFFEL